MNPLLPLLLSSTCLTVPTTSDFPFEKVADEYSSHLGLATARDPDDTTAPFEAVFERSFVRLGLGLFDVRYPVSDLASPMGCKRFQSLCTELLRAQDLWIHWARGSKSTSKSAVPEVDQIKKWLKGWKTRPLQLAAGSDSPRDVATLLNADARSRAALEAFASFMLRGECLGLERPDGAPLTLVLAPTRVDFVGLACVVGALADAARPTLWSNTIPLWTEFRWEGIQVLALEYADPAATGDSAYGKGVAMDSREKTGVEQHVVHHAMASLCSEYFGNALDPGIEAGIPTNIVIELYGEDNARAGGSESGNSTAARSKFVAGGQSQGGKFPRINADSTWRAEKGKDHFLRALRKAQERGAERAGDRRRLEAWFALDSALKPGQGIAVQAPFLGPRPGTEQLANEYVADSREFFRAYSAAFVDWLRTRRTDKAAAASFAALLRSAAAAKGTGTPFEELVAEVYGLPLSGLDRDDGNLEWDFLRQLSRR